MSYDSLSKNKKLLDNLYKRKIFKTNIFHDDNKDENYEWDDYDTTHYYPETELDPSHILVNYQKKKIFINSTHQPIPTFNSEWMNIEIQQNGKKEFRSVKQIGDYIYKNPNLFQVIGFMSKYNAGKYIRFPPEIFIVACRNKFYLTNKQGGVYNTENHNATNNILKQSFHPTNF